MRIHILGICGTFMAGVAVLAQQKGYEVSGCDSQVYPPMSDVLREAKIELIDHYDPDQLNDSIDLYVIGNAMKRGMPIIEAILNRGLPYVSGPQWLSEHILKDRWVLAVAGTHGKTTTSSMLAWILEHTGFAPGFLIGGVLRNFSNSAQLGKAPFFVIEADEYDSAFFDKRSKFIHYHPRTAIFNNLEYDHADIFPDLAAIQTQFHHFARTIPSQGLIIHPAQDAALKSVLAQGCWTPTQSTGISVGDWQAHDALPDGSAFDVTFHNETCGSVQWGLIGEHNIMNALAAIAAAKHVGISPKLACEALAEFKNVKRRLEVRGQRRGVTLYDDFAHHPTAIATTLAGLRQKIGKQSRIIAILELGSYTMRTGVHRNTLAKSLSEADTIYFQKPTDFDIQPIANECTTAHVLAKVEEIVNQVTQHAKSGDHIVVMSNRGFDGIHDKLLAGLTA